MPQLIDQNKIDNLLGLLGPAVLVRVNAGSKIPAEPGWTKLTMDNMRDKRYRSRLAHKGNMGVVLGPASEHLCSIDVDSDEGLAEMLRLNPLFSETLVTARKRGGNIWLRMTGDYPTTTAKLKLGEDAWGEWRAKGGQTIILGEAGGVPYRAIQSRSPMAYRYDDINWPEDVVLEKDEKKSLEDRLDERHGPAYQVGKQGGVKSFNYRWFAAAFLERYDVVFESAENRIFVYEPASGAWERKTPPAFRQMLDSFLGEMGKTDTAVQALRNNRHMTEITERLTEDVNYPGFFSERNPWTIHAENGVLTLNPDAEIPLELKPHSPLWRSRNPLPWHYVPDATCPKFLEQLEKLLPEKDDQDLLQRYAGQILLGRNFVQMFAIIDSGFAASKSGAGQGKSTIGKILRALCGRGNWTQIRTDLLADRFEVASYAGHTLLIAPDVDSKFLSSASASVLKSLTGGDDLKGEVKYAMDRAESQGVYNVVMTSNSRLHVRLTGDTEAWRRRLIIFRTQAPQITKPIPDFDAKLMSEEGPGIFAWAVEGAVRLALDVKERGKPKLSERQANIVSDLLDESDSVRLFVQERVEQDEDSSFTMNAALDAYAEYCGAKGWVPCTTKTFFAETINHMLQIHLRSQSHNILDPDTSRKVRGYTGFKLV